MKTMEDLFYALLQDVYFAERQLLKTLPKMAKATTNEKLKKAFTDHLKQTEGHVDRLEKAFKMLDKSAKAKRCDAIVGLIAEGEEVISEAKDEDVKDAGILAAAQAVEHYEIARYGTLCAWAKLVGKSDIGRLLHKTLEEEKETDELLSSIADASVNEAAAA